MQWTTDGYVIADAMPDHSSYAFFVVWVALSKFILTQLFLAIVMEAFQSKYDPTDQTSMWEVVQGKLAGTRMGRIVARFGRNRSGASSVRPLSAGTDQMTGLGTTLESSMGATLMSGSTSPSSGPTLQSVDASALASIDAERRTLDSRGSNLAGPGPLVRLPSRSRTPQEGKPRGTPGIRPLTSSRPGQGQPLSPVSEGKPLGESGQGAAELVPGSLLRWRQGQTRIHPLDPAPLPEPGMQRPSAYAEAGPVGEGRQGGGHRATIDDSLLRSVDDNPGGSDDNSMLASVDPYAAGMSRDDSEWSFLLLVVHELGPLRGRPSPPLSFSHLLRHCAGHRQAQKPLCQVTADQPRKGFERRRCPSPGHAGSGGRCQGRAQQGDAAAASAGRQDVWGLWHGQSSAACRLQRRHLALGERGTGLLASA